MTDGRPNRLRPIRWLSIVVTLISQGALIVGGLFAAYQFLESRKDARVERTMEYILRYEDGRVGDSRRAIQAALRPFLEQFAEFETGVAPASRDEMVLTLIDEAGDGRLPDHIDTVVDFYEGLWTCVREEICSREVAFGYFTTDARDFAQNFEPYFRRRQENNSAYAGGLERFALADGRKPA